MKQKSSTEIGRLSSDTIKKVVRNESLFHPLTLYPAALGILSGAAALMYNLPILFAGMGSLLAVGATTSIVNYFFRDETISMKYLEKVTEELKKRQMQVLQTLGEDLQQCRNVVGAEKYAQQGVEQFDRIERKYQQLTQLLGKKFSTTELAYGAYTGAAEQLHLSLLDNLLKIVSFIQGAASIDPQYIEQRINDLHNLPQLTPADEREFQALEKRLALRHSQLQQVNSLLTENEESMTIMDTTIAAVAELDIGGKLAESDLRSAMQHLQEIADRTKYYEN